MPSTISEIWGTFKVKAAMIKYLTWYFRPRNSYDPERVDYNALNILAEYQCFNLEFCKNELSLSDKQSASVLDMFWSLLEFDPDEKSVERDIEMKVDKEETLQESSLQHPAGKDQIAYLGDDVLTQEDEAHKQLLKSKFGLFKVGITQVLDHADPDARITIEQARRVTKYAHSTFFRHLRLYDFVLKNTKLSEVKRVYLPIAEPQHGAELSKAMVLYDSTAPKQEEGQLQTASVEGSQHMSAAGMDSVGELVRTHESQ